MSRPGNLRCCRDSDEAGVVFHTVDCDWVARNAREFRFGLWRHYKGGVYHAITLVIHHETRRPMVLYESYTYGGTNVRPLVGWPGDFDGWLDEIEIVRAEDTKEVRVFPTRNFRFEFVGELPSDEKITDRIAAFEIARGLPPSSKLSG